MIYLLLVHLMYMTLKIDAYIGAYIIYAYCTYIIYKEYKEIY